jgi:hypothetical protein
MSDKKISTVSLKNLLVASKSATVEYPGLPGFKVDVSFLSRETLQSIRKKATTSTFKRGSVTESLNDDLFLQLYVAATIKGWSGLTLAFLAQLAPVNLDGADASAELEFSEENALYLMKNSTTFDNWVSDLVSDLGNFK